MLNTKVVFWGRYCFLTVTLFIFHIGNGDGALVPRMTQAFRFTSSAAKESPQTALQEAEKWMKWNVQVQHTKNICTRGESPC